MKFKFTNFKEEDRVCLIMNGLKDPDSQVILLCKQYLAQQLCAKQDEEPKIIEGDEIKDVDDDSDEKIYIQHRVYEPHQLGRLRSVLKSLALVNSSNHKDIKITECVTLLMRDVVLHTYPMELIDTHLKNIVQTRLLSYSKSGNLEDLWEDLIFMNFMIHFKTLIK